MKIIALILLCVLSIIQIERPIKRATNCNAFNQNNKAIDTVTLKAIYINLGMLPRGSSTQAYLEQKKLLGANDFKSHLDIRIPNCTKEYYLCVADQSKMASDILNGELGQELLLTCVVLRNPHIPGYANEPFLIVTKVEKVK